MGALKTPLLLEDAGLFPDEELLAIAEAIEQSHREQIATNLGWIMDYSHAADGLFYDLRSPMSYWPQQPAADGMFCRVILLSRKSSRCFSPPAGLTCSCAARSITTSWAVPSRGSGQVACYRPVVPRRRRALERHRRLHGRQHSGPLV